MIAKSKASEVPNAAGTWVQLQESYVLENDTVGTFSQIGYNAPTKGSDAGKTENFDYTSQKDQAGKWEATSLVKLNDCDAGKTWTLTATATGSIPNQATINYVASMSDAGNCEGLTPSFKKFATSGTLTAAQ